MKYVFFNAVVGCFCFMFGCDFASADNAVAPGAPTGTGASPSGQVFPANGAAFQASATTDEKTASVSANLDFTKLFGGSGQKLLTIAGQTPVGQGTDYTNISTLDGLTKSTSLSFKFTDLLALPSGGLLGPEPLLLLSINGKVGYEQHAYYDAVTFAKTMESKTPFQFGGETTLVVGTAGNFSFNGSFNFQNSYQDSDMGMSQTKCKVTVSPAVSCVTGFIGAPTEKQKGLAEVDFRWIPEITVFGSVIPMGFDPGFTYDAIQHAEAIQFPIYLFTDPKKNLTGGIRYDWTSTNHQSIVGIFVSAAFGVLPDQSSPDGDKTPKKAAEDTTP
jgi:hypothetical protein